ncbi:MAG: glycosyltransferase [Leucobacter sp.]|nr:glycosyltransferase [Leucobacter sp.]
MSTTLQRVILPQHRSADATALYCDVDGGDERGGLGAPGAGSRLSFASYFNAFPAAYWQRTTVIDRVRLTLTTRGAGRIVLMRSDARGVQTEVDAVPVSGNGEVSLEIALEGFEGGGWLWFDLVAGDDGPLSLVEGAWLTDVEPVTEGRLTLGVTTYNKPDFCLRTLEAIGADPALLAAVDRVLIVDQGTRRVRDEPGFADAQARLGEQLRVIEQGNLGGSGGFARAMFETLGLPETGFLMLLDDDIEFETESALRAWQFSRFSREPTIVGGHMFDLLDKPVIHAWSEIVRPENFMWQPASWDQHRHDFRTRNLRATPWMHELHEADYNGWWMCLIPKHVIERIGLSLPVFIKWDDAEYGLRARAHGFRTVSLPGVALWHISWLNKDDTRDWQSFFHARNRIIAGLLHSERPKGGALLSHARQHDIKKLFNMQYYAVQLSVDGLRAVLDGPDALHASLATAMPAARAAAARFPETQLYGPDNELPHPLRGRAPEHHGPKPEGPRGIRLAAFTARTALRLALRRDSELRPEPPELEYAKRDAFWWVIPRHRSVLIESAEGDGRFWFRHDRAKYRRLWRESALLTRRIRRDWDALAEAYRAALPALTSPEEWAKTFAGRD